MEGHYSSSMEENITKVRDIDHIWAYSMSEELNALQHIQMSSTKFTICRVPLHIRKGREKYFEPSMVSIGPYHRGRQHLQPMEAYKLQFLKDFLHRNTKNSLQVYISVLREVEDRARRCYFDYIDITSEEFVKMLLLDGCFIIELFLKGKFGSNDNNMIDGHGWVHDCIKIDLLLLENQIPFFVIKILFDTLVSGIGTEEHERSIYALGILQIMVSFFRLEWELTINIDDVDHILSLYHYVFSHLTLDGSGAKRNDMVDGRKFHKVVLIRLLKPLWLVLQYIYRTLNPKNKHTSSSKATTIPNASKLVEYGIKIKMRTRDYSLIDIAYNDGVLEIPFNLHIDREHRFILFNILGFEQCNIPDLEKLKLSTYFQFMDFLIDSPKDVEILQECGIIVSYLGSTEDTALLFNQLNHYAFVDRENHYLVPLYTEINKFCNSKWHRYKAKLKRDYFSSPWAILSLIAAIILLILTFLQTFFAVYSYFKPPSSTNI